MKEAKKKVASKKKAPAKRQNGAKLLADKPARKMGIERVKKTAAPKKPAKAKTVLSTAAVAEVKQADVLRPQHNFPPVAMEPRQIPGTELVGPYAPVKLNTPQRPLPVVWVRVVKGNERQGRGMVVHAPAELASVYVGATLDYTGGSDAYPAKALSLVLSGK